MKFDVMFEKKDGWIKCRVFNSLQELNDFLIDNKVRVMNIQLM